MNGLKVWAPKAKNITRVAEGIEESLQPGKNGWWSTQDAIPVGTDYGFLIDGEGPYPDPVSLWQPFGVDGLSRVYDQDAFLWTDTGWRAPPLASAIIYELHVGTFTEEGTFAAVEEKLDHLLDLGITHIELLPVAEFSGEHGWGYDGVDWYAPHHHYGDPDALKQLVNACHARGLAVILDVVYNHFGPAGNYLNCFGHYFTDRYHTPWGDAVNFDGAHSDEVRRFVLDNVLMWLRDYHFDGLRLDAIHAILDCSAQHILEQMVEEVAALEVSLQRPLVLIAESDLNDPKIIRPQSIGGFGLHAQWSDDFHHALHALMTGEDSGYYLDFGQLDQLSKALEHGFVYDGGYSQYRKRSHGRPATGVYPHQLLGYLQNHDQIGNRAQGERSSHLLSLGQLKIAAALVLTAPFLPMLFQGEEWASSSRFLYFTDHQDPDLAAAVKAGRQSEFIAFGWQPKDVPDPQDPQTFLNSKLDWQELEQERHEAIFAWHKALVGLRQRNVDLQANHVVKNQVFFDETQQWLMLQRGHFQVVCNFAATEQLIHTSEVTSANLLLASDENINLQDQHLLMPGHSVAILEVTQVSNT